jgi:hypothetical protein
MDTSKQKSILNVVNQIVNKQEPSFPEEFHVIAEQLEKTMNQFEEKFQVKLTEDQEDYLTEVGIARFMSETPVESVELSENIDELINEYEPVDVFKIMLEANMSGMIARGRAMRARLAKDPSKKSGDEEDQQQGSDGEETANVYGFQYQNLAQAQAAVAADPMQRLVRGYMSEEKVKDSSANTLKKHKKKIYKISFTEKGVRKRGTAVSHKGVMRIISGKDNFRIFDEKNRDVTSEFSGKNKKKHNKK